MCAAKRRYDFPSTQNGKLIVPHGHDEGNNKKALQYLSLSLPVTDQTAEATHPGVSPPADPVAQQMLDLAPGIEFLTLVIQSGIGISELWELNLNEIDVTSSVLTTRVG